MRPRILVVAAALTLTAALTSATPNRPAQAAANDLDCAAAAITKDLDNGASWRMCAYIHPIKGLVLEKIEFKPASGVLEYSGYKRVLDQIYLAQRTCRTTTAMPSTTTSRRTASATSTCSHRWPISASVNRSTSDRPTPTAGS
ncbi:hypothetical protein [Aeromicrobium sp. UC242_57]|uniref:hypothetical protein n=1 Tax=Aeromicrobium sp. UC242_57 TaxID=3374624 RepID=UPI00379DA77D